MNDTEIIRRYHLRTRHRPGSWARGPEFVDWENQPDPFRRFPGAHVISLPLDSGIRSAPVPLDLAGISRLLRLSLGLSAWKRFGPDRWALRCNPSSGNLHPTEGYLVCRGIPGLADGVHHYAPREHALERRAELACEGPSLCLLGLTSIPWREAWKYGERAYRYVHLDLGHALGALRFAAAVNGWGLRVESAREGRIASLLGVDRDEDFAGAETEEANLLLQLYPRRPVPLANLPAPVRWQGRANPLGGEPRFTWPVLEEAGRASGPDETVPALEGGHAPEPCPGETDLEARILRRRSAQAFDGRRSTLESAVFFRLLENLLPSRRALPWDLLPWAPRVHPVLFVHRVADLSPGLYALPRRTGAEPLLRAALDPAFAWERPVPCPPQLPLYQLAEGDQRRLARALACHQEIASAGSFSLALLGEFEHTLETVGAAGWRHLHWEAGLVGQALYLEAERAGMRGTGIGCFFDDSVHQALGLTDRRLQSLYLFTVGYPREDARLETLPPYGHLTDR